MEQIDMNMVVFIVIELFLSWIGYYLMYVDSWKNEKWLTLTCCEYARGVGCNSNFVRMLFAGFIILTQTNAAIVLNKPGFFIYLQDDFLKYFVYLIFFVFLAYLLMWRSDIADYNRNHYVR